MDKQVNTKKRNRDDDDDGEEERATKVAKEVERVGKQLFDILQGMLIADTQRERSVRMAMMLLDRWPHENATIVRSAMREIENPEERIDAYLVPYAIEGAIYAAWKVTPKRGDKDRERSSLSQVEEKIRFIQMVDTERTQVAFMDPFCFMNQVLNQFNPALNWEGEKSVTRERLSYVFKMMLIFASEDFTGGGAKWNALRRMSERFSRYGDPDYIVKHPQFPCDEYGEVLEAHVNGVFQENREKNEARVRVQARRNAMVDLVKIHVKNTFVRADHSSVKNQLIHYPTVERTIYEEAHKRRMKIDEDCATELAPHLLPSPNDVARILVFPSYENSWIELEQKFNYTTVLVGAGAELTLVYDDSDGPWTVCRIHNDADVITNMVTSLAGLKTLIDGSLQNILVRHPSVIKVAIAYP